MVKNECDDDRIDINSDDSSDLWQTMLNYENLKQKKHHATLISKLIYI